MNKFEESFIPERWENISEIEDLIKKEKEWNKLANSEEKQQKTKLEKLEGFYGVLGEKAHSSEKITAQTDEIKKLNAPDTATQPASSPAIVANKP